MTKILITGGGGYVGSMLSTTLINLGHEVTVLDLMKYDQGSLNHLFYNKKFKLIKEDVRNIKVLKSLIKKNEFIIPLAALVGAPLCDKFKKEAISTNHKSIKRALIILPWYFVEDKEDRVTSAAKWYKSLRRKMSKFNFKKYHLKNQTFYNPIEKKNILVRVYAIYLHK